MTTPTDRRQFLARLAASGAVAAGVVPLLPVDAPAEWSPPFDPSTDETDEKVFAAARKQFLFPTSVTYCNTGTLGASPREVMTALVGGLQDLERELPDWPYFQADGEPLTGYQQLADFRREAGVFLNAPVDEIAFTQNATMGMSMLANGLDLARGDEVVTTDQEHSGGIGGWLLRGKRHGVVVTQIPMEAAFAKGPDAILQAFADAITPRTRVVMFSQITSGLGVRLPTKELCTLAHDRGALAIVDGAQAIGQIAVDVKALGCDAYVASPHKWLLAPKGTGILYITRALQPRVWNTLASGGFDDDTTGAFRFMHYGTGSLPVMHGLRAALRFINRIGIDRIERWDTMLTARLRAGLATIPLARVASPPDARLAAGITTFSYNGQPGRELQNALWARKIRVRAQGGSRGVRLSAHLYVSPADIDRVVDVTASMAATR
ncbi:MAG: aminotransferase class V-fold PLP-dependent enzyme [Gemmatimonadaceae bacterium]|jgi:isopenicillin-N epimerase|nr:aminotransferase class V-fold PLP-dependent enzyme [Gemmatimonadaceae bacterium]MCC6432995.1 aminotransferase class V-fold PLP-dependent enzyme [Gemmatimonadaceae bacterium]